jgi:hypothetical protein
MGNLLFAATDFLVVLGAAAGIWRLWPHRRDGKVRMVRLGLILTGLAALVGTVRFASDQVEELAGLHGLTSTFAGSAGLMLIAAGVALKAFGVKLPAGLTRYVRFGIPVFVGFMMLFPGLGQALGAVPVLALLTGLAAGGALLTRRHWVSGLLWLAAFALVAGASLAIGSSRHETVLGIANWHVYHALLGVWAALTGEATRRLFDSRHGAAARHI